MLPLKFTAWLLPGCQPTPETWSPMPLQVVEYWLPAEPTVMQAEPWPLFHICQYMPLVVLDAAGRGVGDAGRGHHGRGGGQGGGAGAEEQPQAAAPAAVSAGFGEGGGTVH